MRSRIDAGRFRIGSISAFLIVSLIVASCAAGNEGGSPDAARPVDSAGSTSDSTISAGVSEAVNALELKGPASVPSIPDVVPLAGAATPNLPATVTDSRGRQVEIKSADRVIALDLYATLTDTIIGLGLSDRLVARAKSDTQASLSDLPVVSRDGLDLNVEAILSLKPDLILTNLTIGSERIFESLESAGVTVVRFDHVPKIAEIPASIENVGAVFGMAESAKELADRTARELDEAKAEIDALASATPRKPRAIVVYVRGTGGIFFILGPGYGASDVIDAVLLDDVAGAAGIDDLVPANPESFIELDPEIILTMEDALDTAGGVDGLLGRQGVAQTTAGRSKRIVIAEDNQLLSYGPRTPANLVALARTIYTDTQDG